MNIHNILITDIESHFGRYIYRELSKVASYNVFAMSEDRYYHKYKSINNVYFLNYHSKKELKSVIYDVMPNYIINTIDYNVDCEKSKSETWKYNVALVENLCRICRQIESHLISFSNVEIFGDKNGPFYENDIPEPNTYYGKTKLASDNAIIKNLESHTIIRYSNLIFDDYAGDVAYIENLASHLDEKYCGGNSSISLTNMRDLINALKIIIGSRRKGIYNVSCPEIIEKKYFLDKFGIVFTDELEFGNINSGLIVLKAVTDLGIELSSAYETIDNKIRLLNSFG